MSCSDQTGRIASAIVFVYVSGLIMSIAFGPLYLVEPLLNAFGEPPREVLEPVTTRFLFAVSLANLGLMMLASKVLFVCSSCVASVDRAAASKNSTRMATALGLGSEYSPSAFCVA